VFLEREALPLRCATSNSSNPVMNVFSQNLEPLHVIRRPRDRVSSQMADNSSHVTCARSRGDRVMRRDGAGARCRHHIAH